MKKLYKKDYTLTEAGSNLMKTFQKYFENIYEEEGPLDYHDFERIAAIACQFVMTMKKLENAKKS